MSALAVVAVVVLALIALVRRLEPRMAFFPATGEAETPGNFGVPFEGVPLTTSDGETLRAWRMTAPNARARIVYFHGNGGNLSNWSPILAGIVKRGYSVFAVDYRGYGLSTGIPTERGLYRDVEAAVTHAWEGAHQTPIVYWGRSLGVSMAAYGATVRKPDGLLLEAGFPSAQAVVRSSPLLAILSVFASYRFPAGEFANRAGVPVLLMHGDHDTVIPYRLGRALHDEITAPKRFFTIAGGDHNDAQPPDLAAYWSAIDAFVTSLPR